MVRLINYDASENCYGEHKRPRERERERQRRTEEERHTGGPIIRVSNGTARGKARAKEKGATETDE